MQSLRTIRERPSDDYWTDRCVRQIPEGIYVHVEVTSLSVLANHDSSMSTGSSSLIYSNHLSLMFAEYRAQCQCEIIMEDDQVAQRFIKPGSHKGKGLAVFTSGGDSQGI